MASSLESLVPRFILVMLGMVTRAVLREFMKHWLAVVERLWGALAD